MAAAKQFWTTFVSVLFALFASLGLATPATARGEKPAVPGDTAAGTPTAVGARSGAPASAAASPHRAAPGFAGEPAHASVRVPAQRTVHPAHSGTTYSGRSHALPPTLKQRIRAEAHGSSPSVRHLRADAHAPVSTDLAHLTDQTDETSPALAPRTAKSAKATAAA
ncbi:DUF6344 domain-containing protein [Streptomyces laurentii]|uniref:DUF6344 domain-containing protein n=1 Tax=Streptomyces laurentii TaxID=39478 RepID=UPI00369106CB